MGLGGVRCRLGRNTNELDGVTDGDVDAPVVAPAARKKEAEPKKAAPAAIDDRVANLLKERERPKAAPFFLLYPCYLLYLYIYINLCAIVLLLFMYVCLSMSMHI